MAESYYVGLGLKFKINITGEGFNQATNPYTVVASCNNKNITYTQDDIHQEGNDYYLCIDTSVFKPGTLKLIITADIPDEAFEGGYRKEIDVKVIGPLKNI